MENFKSYEESHKIRNLWDDIKRLIAIEENIMARLDALEKSIEELTKRQNARME